MIRVYAWCCWCIRNICWRSSSLLIGIAWYCMKPSKIEIGHLYVIFSNAFGVSTSMHWQSPLFSSENDIVYGIQKYAGFSHINVTPSLVFVRILPLKYITIFALIFFLSFLFYTNLYSPLFFFLRYTPLALSLSDLQSSLHGLEWEGSGFI